MQLSLFTVLSFKTVLFRLGEKLLGKNYLCCALLHAANYTLELNIMRINLAYHTSRGPGGVQFFYQKFCLVERKTTLTNCPKSAGIWAKWTHGVCSRCYLTLMYLLGIHDHVSIWEIPKSSFAY